MPDRYMIAARIAPAYIILSPLLALAIALGVATTPAALGGAAVLAAIGVLAAELVRSAGQRIEPDLWRAWGGGPAQRLLRWQGSSDTEIELRHHAVTALTGIVLPSRSEESASPNSADESYEAAIKLLRPLTHDDRYPLVAAENISYGFRRNLLACKPAALVASCGVLASAIIATLARTGTVAHRGGPLIAAAAWSLALFVTLVIVVRKPWVRGAADRYAAQLMTAAILAARAQDRP